MIPTHQRETRLAFALSSLGDQSIAANDLEVIVVRSPLSRSPFAGAPEGLAVRFLTSTATGPAAQRNAGWRAANAPLVAFIDDDCRVLPDWARHLLTAAERMRDGGQPVVIQGQTEPDPDERHLLFGLARSIEITAPSGLYETCNIAYPRELLEVLGGFDETFTYPWAEDTDLGLRAEDHGIRLEFVEEAIAFHAVHATPLPQALKGARKRRDFPLLVKRHQRLRTSLKNNLFVNVAHRDVAAAAVWAVGVHALQAKRPAAMMALGCLPYLGRVAWEFAAAPEPKSARRILRFAVHVPVRAAVDAVETGWTVRGSFEHRSPVV